MESVSVVFFDLGDTLVYFKDEVISKAVLEISRVTGFEVKSIQLKNAIREELVTRSRRNLNWVKTQTDERRYWIEFYNKVLLRLQCKNISVTLCEYLTNMQMSPQSYALFEDAIPTINQLRKQNIKIGLISNAFPAAEDLLNYLDLSSLFDFQVLSFKANCSKPSRQIYALATKRKAHINPQQSLFIDDRPAYVTAAREAGMNAILIDRDDTYKTKKGQKVRELSQILENFSEPTKKSKFSRVISWVHLLRLSVLSRNSSKTKT